MMEPQEEDAMPENKPEKMPVSKGFRGHKCKYCNRKFNQQHKLKSFHRHIRNHEKKYRKHWVKKKEGVEKMGDEENKENFESDNQDNKSNLQHEGKDGTAFEMLSEEVYAYVVFAPEGVCRCEPDGLSSVPCECDIKYKKLIFDSIDNMHKSAKKGVSYDCLGCKKKVLSEKLQNDSVLTCLKCNDAFVNMENLCDHEQACYGFKQTFHCQQCKFKTESHEKILLHTATHDTDSTTVVKITNAQRSGKRKLANAYPCPICGERYPDADTLKEHVITHQKSGGGNRLKPIIVVQTQRGRKEQKMAAPTTNKKRKRNEKKVEQDLSPPPVLKSGMSLRPRKQAKPSYRIPDEQDDDDFVEIEIQDTSLPHKCNFCERAFKQAAYLQNHKHTMHSGKAPYVCLVCLERFTRRDDFNQHGQNHADTVFKCQICSASFSQMELLHNHDVIHSSSKPFNCTICGARFVNPTSLSKHFKTHPVWDKSHDSVKAAKVQKPQKSISNSYVCPICKAMFNSAQELKNHSKIHEADRFTCKQCGASCQSRQELMEHTRRHYQKPEPSKKITTTTNGTVYKCSFCPKEFKFKSDHKIHEGLHKKYDGKRPEPKKYKCKYCGKCLAFQNDLKIHEQLHETRYNHNEFACKHCDKKFDNRIDLRRHRHNHFRDKLPQPTKCLDCDKVFKYGSFLREHKKTHWPERPFVCVYCKTRFKTKLELDGHEVIHTIGKKHPCLICSRKFTTKKNVRVHMRTHTGEKPYVCSYCPKRFPQISLRRRHERIHTGECPYVCTICERAFPYDSSLKVHYESHRKKGIEVPNTCGMARGERRKNAPFRKPPSELTKPKEIPVPGQAGVPRQIPSKPKQHRQKTSTGMRRNLNPSLTIPPVPMTHASQSPPLQEPHISQDGAPLQVTIQPVPIQLAIPQGEQMQDHHNMLMQRQHHQQQQQQQEDMHSQDSWEPPVHPRYLHHQQNWQPPSSSAAHNWQPITQQLQGNPNWELTSPGNWTGPLPPPAHQGHSSASSVITSALYGIVQRDHDVQRGYQQ
ncbi:uncharacterized protein [Amphiura filiformis]|uniref:uncharacterized protein n=1 Tax=Amphiura filiformis TaxID=82378 RepID=UPI003B20C93B